MEGDSVYGVKEADGDYHYEVRYDAGPGDLAVMEKFDIEYLSQLLREGTLREKEPDVWMLREMDGAQTRDIGSWWHEKLQHHIRTRLKHAAHDYQQWQQQAGARAKEARLVQLRSKLQTLVDAVNRILIPIQNKKQLTLLPASEQAKLKELLGYVASVQPRALDESDLDKAVAYLESRQPYLEALPQTLAPLVAEQARLAAEAAAQQRLAVLRSKLETLLGEANKILQPIQAHSQLQLLPQNEQRTLQEFIARLASLNPAVQPRALDEADLDKAVAYLESRQPYLEALPQTLAPLVAEQARLAAEAAAQQRLAVLRSKLETLLGEANKILQPIQAHSQLQLLPQNEQRTLQEFIARLASLNPAALNETSLSQGIALIEAKKQYLVDLPARIAALEAKRAEQVTALQKEIYNFNLKVKAADLASDYKAVIENCVFIQDCYEKLGALGVDCTQQLAELGRRIKEAQAKLSPVATPQTQPMTPPTPTASPSSPSFAFSAASTSSTAAAAASASQLTCRIIPYTELLPQPLGAGQELGSGGFGTVYRATWQGSEVAVKKLHSAQLTESSRSAFVAEVNVMTKLDSPRLVRLYGACLAPDPYCIVMEYMPRGSLYNLIHSKEQYAWSVSLQLAIDIGNGLAFLHSEKIIHRDLKSLNILLDAEYRAKICDFGLSRVRQEVSVTSTVSANAVGTNAWNAPELFGLKPKYSFASDIYAYGMILWEILTRETPYKDVLDPNEIKSAVKAGEREDIPPTCHPDYKEAIERCWAQAVERRPQASQVVQVLQAQLSSAAAMAVKSWHIAPELKPAGRNAEGYWLIPADDHDMRKVVESYQHCPVPGMEVGRVTIIFNPVLNKSFADGHELLEGRAGNPAFAPKWSSEGDSAITGWRAKVMQRFAAMTGPYQDPVFPHVKIIPVWHGTKAAIVTSIAKTGFANLATTDAGFFGKGLYSSYEAEYAYRAYGPGQLGAGGALMINWIACYSPYPVVGYRVSGYTGPIPDPGDMLKLSEKGNYGNYDAHFVPVRPATSNPNELNYYPCRPEEAATYHELVVFEKTQILPRYIVELQPSLPAAPSMAPLMAAAGMFGGQQATTQQPTQGAAPRAPHPQAFQWH